MSRTFSTNSGSVDSLKVSLRCGCSENARQMRCTVETDTPVALAIERVLQCVAAAGMVSSVVVTTSAIFSSPIWRGAPGRGASTRPSRRFAANRLRHIATVTRVIPSRSAITRLVMPSAASSTISARIASARAIFRRRARACSSLRSASLNSIRTAAPHPMPASLTRNLGQEITAAPIWPAIFETGH